MKILSIDFDYFQNVTKDILAWDYPDGIDLGTCLSQIVWMTRYCDGSPSKERLESVTINQKLLKNVVGVLNQQNQDIPIAIYQSHVEAYDFICDLMEGNFEDELDLINIDFHHDITNSTEILDCGNWISYIKMAYPKMNIKWLGRETSCECYGLNPKDFPIEVTLDAIQNQKFDAVFICRSDSWLPPHLDIYFHELILKCCNHFNDVDIEDCVCQPRDMGGLISQNQKVFDEIKSIVKKSIVKEEVDYACNHTTS